MSTTRQSGDAARRGRARGPRPGRRPGRRAPSSAGSLATISGVATPPLDCITSSDRRRSRARRGPPTSALDVAAQDRADVGVHHRRRHAVGQAHLREDLGGDRQEEVRRELARPSSRASRSCSSLRVGVHEADGERLDAVVDQRPHRGLAAPASSSGVRTSPAASIRSRTGSRRVARHERRRRRRTCCRRGASRLRTPRRISSTSRKPSVVSSPVARAAAGQHRVRRDGGAVDDQVERGRGSSACSSSSSAAISRSPLQQPARRIAPACSATCAPSS